MSKRNSAPSSKRVRKIKYKIVEKMLAKLDFDEDEDAKDLKTVKLFYSKHLPQKPPIKIPKSPSAVDASFFKKRTVIWQRMGYQTFELFLERYITMAKECGDNPFV